jgi:hypothetical protein
VGPEVRKRDGGSIASGADQECGLRIWRLDITHAAGNRRSIAGITDQWNSANGFGETVAELSSSRDPYRGPTSVQSHDAVVQEPNTNASSETRGVPGLWLAE